MRSFGVVLAAIALAALGACGSFSKPAARDSSAGGSPATDGGDSGAGGSGGSGDLGLADLPHDVAAEGAPSSLANGAKCTQATQCASGHCLEGVCCASECAGKCQACAAEFTGLADGVCGPTKAGTDPREICSKDLESSCGNDGTCDGAGECRKYGVGTICGAESCTSGSYTPARVCDGKGACPPSAPVSCGAFPCENGRCRMSCSPAQPCAAGNYCQNGTCVAQKPNAMACGGPEECLSGACADGVCCNDACTGTCMSCRGTDTGMMNGRCELIRAGRPSGNECPRADERTCGNTGACDGKGKCQKYGQDVTCADPQCGDGAQIAAGKCDGNGACAAGARQSCNGLRCEAGRCLACTTGAVGGNCVRSTDYCSGGNLCRPQSRLGETCNQPGEAGACSSGVCAENRACCAGACEAKYQCNSNGKCGWPAGHDCDSYVDCWSEQCDFLPPCSAGGYCPNAADVGDACTGPNGAQGTCGIRSLKGKCA